MLVDAAEGVEDCEGLGGVSMVRESLAARDVLGGKRGGGEGKRRTLAWMCPKLTPSSSINGGSPSYPSVENAANHPVLSPPWSPIRPPTALPYACAAGAPYPPYPACEGVAAPGTPGVYDEGKNWRLFAEGP